MTTRSVVKRTDSINCGVFKKGVCDDCHQMIKGQAFIYEGGTGERCRRCWLKLLDSYPESEGKK